MADADAAADTAGSAAGAAPAPSGTLLLCGATLWDYIGRKASSASKGVDFTGHEIPEPRVYGAAAYINAVRVVSHCTAAHGVIIDDQGSAFTFGRNQNGQLGDGTTTSRTEPYRVDIKNETFVSAAVGRAHTILVAASGRLYAAGDNKSLQLGVKSIPASNTFVMLTTVKGQHFVDAACGADYSLAITDAGAVFSWGSPQYGQTGDGSDHEYIASANKVVYDPQMPKPVSKLEGKKIVAVACGTNHSLAVDSEGGMYAWGCGGYGRLGLNDTPPKNVHVPTEILGFKERQNPIKKVACGPTCCMAIDSRNALHLWGKWKSTGDGGQGTPWLYPKYYQGLSGWNVRSISAGGVTLFALADDSCVSWGQSAIHGELGFGEGASRSATNADIVKALNGVRVHDVACGLGFTLFIADKSKPKKSAPAKGKRKADAAGDEDAAPDAGAPDADKAKGGRGRGRGATKAAAAAPRAKKPAASKDGDEGGAKPATKRGRK
ncbi:hypothetical protein HK105_202376 [Polyrhizophydium stewartii]|uniref:Uncharacterized protein n=1 Tax=Polyrhizophydium stewartii TaxID=2732419 RepID=A0ABR4NEK9_9FUNG|nr:Protein rcc2 [Polyrhizophydium stewartii]